MGFTAGYTVNENTPYAFTVSNETIAEAAQAEGGITEADIAQYCYAALVDNRVYSLHSLGAMASQEAGYDAFIAEYCPYYIVRGTVNPLLNEGMTATHDEIYERNFLVWVGSIYPGTENEKYGTFLVMDIIDIKKWYMDFNTGCFTTTSVSSEITKSGVTTPAVGYTGSCYYYNDNFAQRAVIKSTSEETVNESLFILNVLILNDEHWVGELNPSSGGASRTFDAMNNWNTFTPSYLRGYLDHEDGHIYQAGSTDFAGIPKLYDLEFPDVRDADLVSYPESDNGVLIYTRCNQSALPSYSCFYAKDLNTVLTWSSWSGLKFKFGDTFYKPIIVQGVVVGYTDNMDTPSEYDSMVNVTGNNISPVPPGPVPPPPSGDDDDNDDPVNTTGAPFSAGLCHYYALTAGSTLLDHISEALGTWDIENTHKDLYKNLVSCKLIKPPAAIPTTGSAPFTIYGVKPQYQGADITLPVVTGNPDASFGPYTIGRKFGDFRDYAPYTRVSIFLPYCGWCDLPSHVVGKSVSVKYFTDIIAATCKAVVFCGNNIIAEAAGVIGLDIPFVADNVGAKMQAVTAGMISALGGGIQLGAGIGTMVSTKSGNGAKSALSGASQYLSGYSQMAMAFNENTTEISGKNGDGCCISGATNIIIKIVRPKKGAYTTAPYVPPGYGHSIGFVSQKQVKVSSVSGLLIADNVDTSGISGATEAERAEIKRVLETGLIVNAAPNTGE